MKISWDMKNRVWGKSPAAKSRAMDLLEDGVDPYQRYGCIALGPLMMVFSA